MKLRQNISVARSLRRSANTPEQVAWDVFRKFRKQGFPVRRQHPIGRYVVDFAIVKEKLVIEIDGAIHNLPGVAEKDSKRKKALIDDGWRVLRIPSEMAMSRDNLFAFMQKELGL